jgi:hypothetical protein
MEARVWLKRTPLLLCMSAERGGRDRFTCRLCDGIGYAVFAKDGLEYRGERAGAGSSAPREAGLPIADLTASNPTRCGFILRWWPAGGARRPTRRSITIRSPAGSLRAREAFADTTRTTWRCGEAGADCAHHQHQRGLQLSLPPALRSGKRDSCRSAGLSALRFSGGAGRCALKAAPLVYDQGWQIDPEGFRGRLRPRRGPSCWCTPTIPRATSPSRGRRRNWRGLCREHDLSLIVDEVFLDYGFGQPMLRELCGRVWRAFRSLLSAG